MVKVMGGERRGWWMSGVVNVAFYIGGGECRVWWMSGWWMSHNLFKGNFQLQQISVTSCVSKGATERLSCASQGRLQQGHCLPHYLFHIFTSFSIYFNRLILERMLKWEEAQMKILLCKLLPELLLLSLCRTKIQTSPNNQNWLKMILKILAKNDCD